MLDIHNKLYNCPLELSIDVISGKWKAVILFHLRFGPMRFSHIKMKIPNITQKILTQQLRELENHNLIMRKVYPVVPSRVEYCLTEDAKELLQCFKFLYQWGIHYSQKYDIEVDSWDMEAVAKG